MYLNTTLITTSNTYPNEKIIAKKLLNCVDSLLNLAWDLWYLFVHQATLRAENARCVAVHTFKTAIPIVFGK